MQFHRTVVQQEEMGASPTEMAEISTWKTQKPGQGGRCIRQEGLECPFCVSWSGTVTRQKVSPKSPGTSGSDGAAFRRVPYLMGLDRKEEMRAEN